MDFAEKPRTKIEYLRGRKTPDTDYIDPFELIRKAKSIIEKYEGEEFEQWLRDYNRLPGATLSADDLLILMHSQLRCEHNADAVRKMWGMGLFKEVSLIGRWKGKVKYHLRVNKNAKDALRLRSPDIKCLGNDSCAA